MADHVIPLTDHVTLADHKIAGHAAAFSFLGSFVQFVVFAAVYSTGPLVYLITNICTCRRDNVMHISAPSFSGGTLSWVGV